jgi:hypothetical protein
LGWDGGSLAKTAEIEVRTGPVDGEAISAVTRFESAVMPPFGLPRTLQDEER